mmetsp:Transcript_8075/g.24011  ORF Transcript_8075/g.24011 Transcript_8075/m.24011 type:complete len:220 (-) Transcript_8075:1793-2452(-)
MMTSSSSDKSAMRARCLAVSSGLSNLALSTSTSQEEGRLCCRPRLRLPSSRSPCLATPFTGLLLGLSFWETMPGGGGVPGGLSRRLSAGGCPAAPMSHRLNSRSTFTMPAVLASRNLPVGTRVSSRLSISERFLTGLLGVLRDISLDSADKYAREGLRVSSGGAGVVVAEVGVLSIGAVAAAALAVSPLKSDADDGLGISAAAVDKIRFATAALPSSLP